MSFVEAYRSCFSQYARFSGRARRSEYWYWTLWVALIGAVDAVIEQVILKDSYHYVSSAILGLIFLLPTLAVSVRRLHDTDRSGWWYLIQAVPVIGGIVLLVFFVQDSGPDNRYGPSPKAEARSVAVRR